MSQTAIGNQQYSDLESEPSVFFGRSMESRDGTYSLDNEWWRHTPLLRAKITLSVPESVIAYEEFAIKNAPFRLIHELKEEKRREEEEIRAENKIAFMKRIENLRGFAVEDGVEINPESEKDFFDFIKSGEIKKKALVLTEEGNFEAIWRGEDGEYIALEFVGGNIIKYIMFSKRSSDSSRVQEVNSGSFDEVKDLLFELELTNLIYL